MTGLLRRRALGGHRNQFWLTITVVLALDQLTKHLFAAPAGGSGNIVIVPMFLRLIHQGANTRGAFSLGPEGATFYVLAAAAGLVLIGWFLFSAREARPVLYVSLGSVAGGALGNLIDRIILGAVRDFIDLHWMDRAHWPIFNVADVAICVGVALLVWETFRRPGRKATERAAGGAEDPSR